MVYVTFPVFLSPCTSGTQEEDTWPSPMRDPGTARYA